MPRRLLRFLFLFCGLLPGAAAAQTASFTLGFAGEVVSAAWNPLRVSVRDQRNVTVSLRIDQGSLRSGPRWVHYQADIAGGPGLHVFEDDVYVPEWASLIWTVSSAGRTLASGAFSPRERDARPVNLLPSSSAGRHLPLLAEGSRVVELDDASLPQRLAPFTAVDSLLIDGSTSPPPAAAVAAAAAAGTRVLLLTPLPGSHAELLLLAPEPVNQLGAGLVIRGEAGFLRQQLELNGSGRAAGEQLLAALGSLAPVTLPAPAPLSLIVLAIIAYALLALLLIRFAGTAGFLAMLGVGFLACLVAWQQLRPGQGSLLTATTLAVSAGGLSKVVSRNTLLELPGGQVTLPGAFRPLEMITYLTSSDGMKTSTELNLRRWQIAPLAARPELAAAALSWSGDSVLNSSGRAFQQVVVKGLGEQGSLAAGGRLDPRPGETGPGGPLGNLLPFFPAGSVAAFDGSGVQLLLPRLPASGAAAGGVAP
jgi:hypothetical protein